MHWIYYVYVFKMWFTIFVGQVVWKIQRLLFKPEKSISYDDNSDHKFA